MDVSKEFEGMVIERLRTISNENAKIGDQVGNDSFDDFPELKDKLIENVWEEIELEKKLEKFYEESNRHHMLHLTKKALKTSRELLDELST